MLQGNVFVATMLVGDGGTVCEAFCSEGHYFSANFSCWVLLSECHYFTVYAVRCRLLAFPDPERACTRMQPRVLFCLGLHTRAAPCAPLPRLAHACSSV